MRFFTLRVTVEPKIPGAVIPRRVFTHGVIPGWSHTPAPGISSPSIHARSTSWGPRSRRAAMEHYVGLDVSLKLTAICIVDRTGKIEREGVVSSDPEARLPQTRRLSCLGMSASPPTSEVRLRRSELTLGAKSGHRIGIARQASSGSISSTNHTTRLLFASYR